MAYRDDISALNADHHWDFDGDALDQIGSTNGINSGGIFTDTAITLDATNCWTTNGLTDRITLSTTIDINNSAQARKTIAGWFSTTSIQAPPSRIYGEGTNTTCYQFVMGYGNNMMFEVTEPTNFPDGLQVYGPVAQPNRVYHLCGIFLGSAYDNEVKFFVDGVLQTLADPTDRTVGTASLDARGVPEFGDPVGTTGAGGGVLLQQGARNGKYQHWASWGDTAAADLTDSEVRETLFERGALAEETIATDTEANMQIDVDALTAQPDAACCIEVNAPAAVDSITLISDVTFDDKASIHVRNNHTTGTLTWVNVSGGNASIGSAPFGGNITIATRQTLTVTILDATDLSVISGARVYIEADTGGDLAQGTEIMNTITNGSGVATETFDYTSDQPIIGRVRSGSNFYKTSIIGSPLTSDPLNVTILMVPDE